MNIYCTFIGHSRLWGAPIDLESQIFELVEKLVITKNVTAFYCGGMGEFDLLCASVVRRLKRKYPLKLYLVIPYMTNDINNNGDYYSQLYDDIICPNELMGVHYKSAIGLRNKWMVDKSSYAVCYVKNDSGGAHTSFVYAKKKQITIYNLTQSH